MSEQGPVGVDMDVLLKVSNITIVVKEKSPIYNSLKLTKFAQFLIIILIFFRVVNLL